MAFRFVHTADLHLDSPFAGLTAEAPESVARTLRESTSLTWQRVVGLAIDAQADFVVVAGDVFELQNHTLLGQVRFRDGLADLSRAGIPAFVATGNHDPEPGWERGVTWPPSAHRFGPDRVVGVPVLRDGEEIARVYGIGHATANVRDNLARRFARDSDVPFAVGVLHANVGGQPGHAAYAPCSIADLRATGMEYWALGHIHRPAVLCETGPTVIYAGNPQGRDPGEIEPRGCFVVDVDRAGLVHPRFEPVDVVRWQAVRVEIDGLEDDDALIDAVVRAVGDAQSAAGRSIVARVTLVGRGPVHARLRRTGAAGDVRQLARERLGLGEPFAWIESVADRTRPPVDVDRRREAPDFLGAFLREVADLRTKLAERAPTGEIPVDADEHEGRRWLERELAELFDSRRARLALKLDADDAERLRRLVDEAERLVVDRLAEAD